MIVLLIPVLPVSFHIKNVYEKASRKAYFMPAWSMVRDNHPENGTLSIVSRVTVNGDIFVKHRFVSRYHVLPNDIDEPITFAY